MRITNRFRPLAGLLSAFMVAGLMGLATAAHAGPTQGYLYVGDLLDSSLLRFDATYPSANYGNPAPASGQSGPNYIVGYGVTEGVHGTGNTLITTAGNSHKISRFALDGTFVNDIATGFSGIGNIEITPDATYIYVPDEAASTLYRVKTVDGTSTSVSLGSVHDVTIGRDGYVYVSSYSTGNSGVIRYNADLTNPTTFIANGNNGLTRPAGMVFSKDGNSFYVVQNTNDQSDGSVLRYDKDGNGNFNYRGKVTSSILKFGFGIDIGPDGDLYMASLGTFQNQSYTNCIAKIILDNSTTSGFGTGAGAVSGFIANPPGVNNFGPKYLKFDTNFVDTVDPGAPNLPVRQNFPNQQTGVPEPGEVAFAGIFALGLTGLVVRARRRAC